MQKLIGVLCLCLGTAATATPIYHCQNEQGDPVFQAGPCSGQTIQVITSQADNPNAQYGQSVIRALSQMTGKAKPDLSDPKMRQAAEVLAVTDAAKSYAFTQIYAVSAKHCGAAVQAGLDEYQAQAAVTIALGKYYYQTGIQATIGTREFNESAAKLTAGLQQMTDKLEQEHQDADAEQLQRKCQEASQALASLALLYANQ